MNGYLYIEAIPNERYDFLQNIFSKQCPLMFEILDNTLLHTIVMTGYE
mgnify:CR=1 FL=1